VKPATQKGSSVVVDLGDNVTSPSGGPGCNVTTSGETTVPAKFLCLAPEANAKAKTKKVQIASAVTSVPAGSSKRITVKLNKTGAKLLRKLKKLKAKFTVTVRAGSGAPVVRTHSVTLKQPKKKKKK
jgi:hypothetical protein